MSRKERFKLEIIDGQFVIKDKPLQLISGAIHYFRIHPEQWQDRLLKLKACGLNCVETYVPWNMHEPGPGEFNFSGFYDLERFIEIADMLGLYVIVRPGPYICSEFEGGGLPWWLNNIPGMVIRCGNAAFLQRCKIFYDELMPRLKPFMSCHGGPVIAMQLENEYGSYGNDKNYLRKLQQIFESHEADVLFFTSDDAAAWVVDGGSLPEIFKTVNFGSGAKDKFALLHDLQPDKPRMCMEFWCGWFDHWGLDKSSEKGGKTSQDDDIEYILDSGASLNFYMFSGGTNFGFNNGANLREKFAPTITSYDFGAPITECGDLSEKYYDIKRLIAQHLPGNDIQVCENEKLAYGKVQLLQSVSLFDTLDNSAWIESANPLCMEELEQGYGFVLYRTRLTTNFGTIEPDLYISGLHDRAWLFLDGNFKGILTRENAEQGISIGPVSPGMQLDILVENMGRVNFGLDLLDRKGITGHVRFAGERHFGWQMLSLPLTDLSRIDFDRKKSSDNPHHPRFFRGTFGAGKIADTFLSTDGWTKGVAFINGFNLGRYWAIGPQKTLYIPAPLLKAGENELILFELEGNQHDRITLTDKPVLG